MDGAPGALPPKARAKAKAKTKTKTKTKTNAMDAK
jgi:hypothetical protein